jgi:hypothetical protein
MRFGTAVDHAFDSLGDFIDSVRARTSGTHVVIGPVCYGGEDGHRLVQIAAAARRPSLDKPCASIALRFGPPQALNQSDQFFTWRADRAAQNALASTMQRMFATLEVCTNQLDFARAIERCWPCALTTAAREQVEVNQRRWIDWERRRSAYVAKRTREGETSWKAAIEFLNQGL